MKKLLFFVFMVFLVHNLVAQKQKFSDLIIKLDESRSKITSITDRIKRDWNADCQSDASDKYEDIRNAYNSQIKKIRYKVENCERITNQDIKSVQDETKKLTNEFHKNYYKIKHGECKKTSGIIGIELIPVVWTLIQNIGCNQNKKNKRLEMLDKCLLPAWDDEQEKPDANGLD